ncbi:hypothetical protein [Corynebacterium epidermidicanis]|uniref:Uncharacterized protein n=1 Tax=Corynebacterium epidermidicanis TaxID=1050174 RepID=A0A0G3GTT6_9CORY|nr:hypothetical protein [Corynebacterium epidermidicanis]AKK02968.1 hypothetical protein CEPID_05505 [Corynebacterium epidermidicanis]
MTLMWATRGQNWGFQFLEDGGELDPLPTYKRAFANKTDVAEFVGVGSEFTAARIMDPLGRTDHAGRVIPHDFVLRGKMAEGIHSIEDVQEIIWPIVAEKYDEIWGRKSF